MQKNNKIFEDMARLASGAAGMAFDAKKEAENALFSYMEKFLLNSDFVTRDEFEIQKEITKKMQIEIAELTEKLKNNG